MVNQLSPHLGDLPAGMALGSSADKLRRAMHSEKLVTKHIPGTGAKGTRIHAGIKPHSAGVSNSELGS